MKKKILTLFFLLIGITAFGQINMADSTVQVIAYWDKGEKQNYTITEEKIKLKGIDTTLVEKNSYDVEISVIEQTDSSYTIQWLYKNFKTNSTSPIVQKLRGIINDMKIVYKTDELGEFVEVVNWEELKDYNQKIVSQVAKEFEGTPEIDKVIGQTANIFATKEAFESASIKEIQQFHSFHGAKYKLNEDLECQIKAPNVLGTEPFDCYLLVYLDEINEVDNNYILRMTQEFDSEQLTNAAFDYLTDIATNLKIAPPKRDELKDIINEIQTASRIHGTGWIIYSVQTMTLNSDDVMSIEERIIEIQ